MCENGGGAGLGGSDDADAAGLCGDDGLDDDGSAAMLLWWWRVDCSGDSRPPLLRLEHSLTISSSWPVMSGDWPPSPSNFSSLLVVVVVGVVVVVAVSSSPTLRFTISCPSRLRCSSFKRSALRHLARRFWNQTCNSIRYELSCLTVKFSESTRRCNIILGPLLLTLYVCM